MDTPNLRYRARHMRPSPGDGAALRHLIAFLDRERLISAQRMPARRLTPIESCTLAYIEYLHEARALSKATIVYYVPFIRSFSNIALMTGPSGFRVCVPAMS